MKKVKKFICTVCRKDRFGPGQDGNDSCIIRVQSYTVTPVNCPYQGLNGMVFQPKWKEYKIKNKENL